MEIMIAVHDKAWITNVKFCYFKEDNMVYQSTSSSLSKVRKHAPIPVYKLWDKDKKMLIQELMIDKVQISFKLANKIDCFFEMSFPFQSEIVFSSYFLNELYKEKRTPWIPVYEWLFTKWIARKDLQYDIGHIQDEEIHPRLSNISNKENLLVFFPSFMRKLEIQEEFFEHFTLFLERS